MAPSVSQKALQEGPSRFLAAMSAASSAFTQSARDLRGGPLVTRQIHIQTTYIPHLHAYLPRT